MQTNQLIDILRILNTAGVGPVTFYDKLNKFGNFAQILQDLSLHKEIPSIDWAQDEINKAKKFGAQIITYQDDLYPAALKELNDAPPVLYAKGNIELLQHPISIAVVGARNASISGRKMASRIAYDLTNNDILVVSGMARGIDAAAHKGALYARNQQGPTIAVLGTGIDEIYPSENKELYYDIQARGLLLSELPMGSKAQVANFPRRNRIISALTCGTVIVEADLHSGSLITARLALEQGKDIFAVPGSPMESRSAGPNSLIKDGAILTESATDIIENIQINASRKRKNFTFNSLPLDKAENNVNISAHQENDTSRISATTENLLDLIDYVGVDIDELLATSHLNQSDFFTQLLDLEMSEKVERRPGNKVVKIK